MDELKPRVVVLISADAEWRAIRRLFPQAQMERSPYGAWFSASLPGKNGAWEPLFFQGGWGKISAAGSTQYVIDRWKPELLLNLGTCGGFEGQIERGALILANCTLVYDIFEQMGDFDQHIAHYTTDIDLSWLCGEDPPGVRRALLVSGDRDLVSQEIPELKARYGAAAGDWESGAIAFVARRNGARLLILRAVSDLVGGSGGEAYGKIEVFEQATRQIMQSLVEQLPAWLERALG